MSKHSQPQHIWSRRITQHLRPDGSVTIPPRIAAWIEEACGLTADRRIRLRDTDPDAYAALAALHLSAMASGHGTKPYAPQPHTTQSEMWLTTKQAATALGVTDRCIRNWCTTGQLTATHVGGHWLIHPHAITHKKEDTP